MLERLANRPFRQRPGLNGLLFGVALLVLYAILIPPLFWVVGRLFWPVLEPIGHALVWWWKAMGELIRRAWRWLFSQRSIRDVSIAACHRGVAR